jgi:hypothetical protein
MTTLQSDIEDAAEHDTQKSCIVQLGARYPNRILFFNEHGIIIWDWGAEGN